MGVSLTHVYNHCHLQRLVLRARSCKEPMAMDDLATAMDDLAMDELVQRAYDVDLNGEVHVSQEVFATWFEGGAACAARWPCAAAIHRYAVDQQGHDFRGSVSSDTAWEMCCRLMSLRPEQNKLGTRDLAQLLVYWLEEEKVPARMREGIYDGMVADLRSREKRVETWEDEQLMKCRWVRQAVHAELDSMRNDCASRGVELPVDFEVDGDIAAREQGPANAEALEQATALLRDLRRQGSSSSTAFVAAPDADGWDEDAIL